MRDSSICLLFCGIIMIYYMYSESIDPSTIILNNCNSLSVPNITDTIVTSLLQLTDADEINYVKCIVDSL
jgi:hypothetical protein